MIKFSEDQQMIMDLAREIAEENIKPLASKYDQEESRKVQMNRTSFFTGPKVQRLQRIEDYGFTNFEFYTKSVYESSCFTPTQCVQE